MKYVIVEASEIKKIRPPKEKGINVASFITDGSIDIRYFTGKNYHLVPDGPIARTPYEFLQRAMADSGQRFMRPRHQFRIPHPGKLRHPGDLKASRKSKRDENRDHMTFPWTDARAL